MQQQNIVVLLLLLFNIGVRSSPPIKTHTSSITSPQVGKRPYYMVPSSMSNSTRSAVNSWLNSFDDRRKANMAQQQISLGSGLVSAPAPPSSFYMSSRAEDVESRRRVVSSSSSSSIPIIMPAAAQLALPGQDDIEDVDNDGDDDDEDELENALSRRRKKKKNFSQLARNLLLPAVASRGLLPLDLLPKAARSNTPAPKKKAKVELNGYCGYRSDGLYEDPNECESFIICFAGRTFRTKCAYGTSWNHIRKECDFPEKVDCERRPSTTTEEATTETTTEAPPLTTPVFAPKLSAYTVRNNQNRIGISSSNIDDKSSLSRVDKNILSNMRLNILLTLILIPTIIFLVALVAATMFYWRRKFRLARHRLDFSNSVKQIAVPSITASPQPNDTDNNSSAAPVIAEPSSSETNSATLTKCGKKRLAIVRKLACLARICKCISRRQKQFKPKLIMSCASTGSATSSAACGSSYHHHHNHHHRLPNVNHIDLVRGQITSSSNLALSTAAAAAASQSKQKLLNQSITLNYAGAGGGGAGPASKPQRQEPAIASQPSMSLIDVCNHHASQSHVTLSSHFEENNWDYNFATRGLYLSQPWVRGRYNHTLGSESMGATSGVLTLDPTTELSLEFNQPTTTAATATATNGTRFIDIYGETGGSDTDGYYA